MTSPVWRFFTKILNTNTAKCNLYGAIRSNTGSTTSALLAHLKTSHSMDYNKITNHKSNEDGDDLTKIQNFVKPLEGHLLAQFACRDRLSINQIASIPICRES